MTREFFSDPLHVWMAAAVVVVCIGLFAGAVHLQIGSFLRTQRKLFQDALVHGASIDAALSAHGGRVASLSERIDHHGERIEALEGWRTAVEARRPIELGEGRAK